MCYRPFPRAGKLLRRTRTREREPLLLRHILRSFHHLAQHRSTKINGDSLHLSCFLWFTRPAIACWMDCFCDGLSRRSANSWTCIMSDESSISEGFSWENNYNNKKRRKKMKPLILVPESTYEWIERPFASLRVALSLRLRSIAQWASPRADVG